MSNTTNTIGDETPESPNTAKQVQHTLNVHDLFDESFGQVMGKPIQPQKLNEYTNNQASIYNSLMDRVRTNYTGDRARWSHIPDTTIGSEITVGYLKEAIAKASKNLLWRRKTAYDRAIHIAKNLTGPEKGALENKLRALDEKQLGKLIASRSDMRNQIKEWFPQHSEVLQAYDRVDFTQIFHDRSQYMTDDNRVRFEKIYKNFVEGGQRPDTGDISYILDVYTSAPDSRKKEILTALDATISVEQAINHGILTDMALDPLIVQVYGDIYHGLDADQKSRFRDDIKYSRLVLSVADLDAIGVKNLWGNQILRDTLKSSIAEGINFERNKPLTGILGRIRERKRKEAEDKNEIEISYDVHDEFVEELRLNVGGAEGTGIDGIELLKTEGSIVKFEDSSHGTQFFRIKKIQHGSTPLEVNQGADFGVELEELPIEAGSLRRGKVFGISYDHLFESFKKNIKGARVIQDEEFKKMLVSDRKEAIDGKIYNARDDIDADPVTALNIAAKLDLIDEAGRDFGFEKGTTFIAPSVDDNADKKTNQKEVWQVHSISGDHISLMAGNGFILKDQSISMIYEVLSSLDGFHRTTKLSNDEDMKKQLGEFGVDHDAKLKDGQITISEKDDHGHKQEKNITCFSAEDGGHIRIESIKDGVVSFGEFDDNGNKIEDIKGHAQKHGLDKKIQGLYIWQRMSYPAFLEYLKENKLTASKKDIFIPDAKHAIHDHHEHAHMTGSLLSRIMKWQNPASIWKGFEMIWHGLEHTLEKGAKLDAARFAMGTARMFGFDETGVGAQIYADITEGSKEIVEKIKNKINGIPGPAGRLKCIHIAHNKDSRPEEVAAAMQYLLESYGHLYAEDIKGYQSVVNSHNIETADPGYFAFLDAFIITAKVGDLKTYRKKAYKKALGEMGDSEDHEGEPTEEQLIHALFKTIDGNWGDFPYAAAVVKATGGPGGFENMWKFEGYKKAHEKGVNQTKMVNAQGRLNKAVGYLNTHEIYKAIGSMEAVAGKAKVPKYQAIPFIWACGGYSRYASHTALQEIKKYAEGGLSFHAYGFMRKEDDNTLYRQTVRLALQDLVGSGKISQHAVSDFDMITREMLKGPKDPNNKNDQIKSGKYAGDTYPTAMMKFWQEYQGKGLHDMLQGKNGWMVSKARKGDPIVKGYKEHLAKEGNAHGQTLLSDNIPGSEFGKDWYDEHGYEHIILREGENGLNSLQSMLNKIKFGSYSGGGKPMNEEHTKKIWKYVKEHVQKGIKDDTYWGGGDSALQKEQYLAYRKEIIAYFDQQLGARVKGKENAATLIETYPYFQDIADMGIDPYAIFDASIERGSRESDYIRWKDGGGGGVRRKKTPSIQDMISGKAEDALHPKTPTNFIQPTKKNPLIGSNKPVGSPDSDAHQGGGAEQIDGDTDHGADNHH